MKKEWIRLKDLMGLYGFPQTIQGITLRAKQEGWQRRQVEGVKGRVFEYHISSLPPDIVRQVNERGTNQITQTEYQSAPIFQRSIQINENLLIQAIEALELRLQTRKQTLAAAKKAKLILFMCNAYNKQSPISPATLDQLLDLAI